MCICALDVCDEISRLSQSLRCQAYITRSHCSLKRSILQRFRAGLVFWCCSASMVDNVLYTLVEVVNGLELETLAPQVVDRTLVSHGAGLHAQVVGHRTRGHRS